jgi:hypothetical protein
MSDEQAVNVPISTLEQIKRQFDSLQARIDVLEKAPPGGEISSDSKHARVLKHIYDWAQHFGMPALPSQAERPKPAPVPPPIQPEGFQL